MEILHFKTNIDNGQCVQRVSQEIDKISTIKNWEVETASNDKIMTVRGASLESQKIIKATKKAGFRASLIGQVAASK